MLDDSDLKTVDLRLWRAKVREIVDGSSLTQTAFASRYRFPVRTLQSWVGEAPATVRLESILKWHETSLFPLAEQMRLLFGEDVLPNAPAMTGWGMQRDAASLIAQLADVVDLHQRIEPGVADFVRAIEQSCIDSGDLGRWEARVMTIVFGWHFPWHGTDFVEFRRRKRPSQRTDHSDGYVEAFLESAPHPRSAINRHISTMIASSEPPDEFRPDAPDRERRAGWRTIRLERYELTARLLDVLKASTASWSGAARVTTPDLFEGGDLAGRHLLSVPRTPLMRRPNQIPLEGPACHTILIIGPAGLSPNRIAHLIGSGIGWNSISNRVVAHQVSGHRVSQSNTAAVHDRVNDQVLRHLVDTHGGSPRRVIAFEFAYLERDGKARSAAEELFRQPGVLPVVLVHPPASVTSRLWAMRKDENGADTDEEAHLKAIGQMDRWSEVARDVPGAIIATILPTRLLAGTAVGQDGPGEARAWLSHPINGDMILRNAFEIANALVTGRPDSAPKTHRFIPDSVLGRHQRQLAACTGGRYWGDPADWLDFDERYLEPPAAHDEPIRARTVRIEVVRDVRRASGVR